MDDLFDVKHGITIRGMEYGFVGIGATEIDQRVDDMLLFVESFKGSAGGTFGEEIEACIDFPYDTLTLEKFAKFEKQFRDKYPTFDGHLFLHDLNHFTVEESKVLDAMNDQADFDDDEWDEEPGDAWKSED